MHSSLRRTRVRSTRAPRWQGVAFAALSLAAAGAGSAATAGAGTGAGAGDDPAKRTGNSAAVLVLDASGSMWGQLHDGASKISVAWDVVGDYLRTRDASAPLAVIAYGHRRRSDCTDIEVIAPSGRHDPESLTARLLQLSPRGMTPIADSLLAATRQIPRDAERADIVLITDGLETCHADPCAVAGQLAQEGISIRAHVVGFGLSEAEAAVLSCVTEQTGGLLLRPQSGAELSAALDTISAAQSAPEPPAATLRNHFVFKDVGTGTPRGRMTWHATSEAGETVRIGVTDGTQQSIEGIAAALPAGTWTIVAEGPEGRAELTLALTACCHHHSLPFVGAPFSVRIPPLADVQAGMAARIPYEITHAGAGHPGGTPYKIIATGPAGALVPDQIVLRDLITSREPKIYGGATGQLPPGEYRLVVALMQGGQYRIVAERTFRAVEEPVVRIVGPDQASPGESITLSLDGGYATGYVFEVVDAQERGVGRSTALYQGPGGSLSLQLNMPAVQGDFELVVRNGKRIIARKPIRITANAAPADATGSDKASTGAAPPAAGDEDATEKPLPVAAHAHDAPPAVRPPPAPR